jgi:hypothetical protein
VEAGSNQACCLSGMVRSHSEMCWRFNTLCLMQDGQEHRDYWISDGLYGGFNNIQVPCHDTASAVHL